MQLNQLQVGAQLGVTVAGLLSGIGGGEIAAENIVAIAGDAGPHAELGPASGNWSVIAGVLPSGMVLDEATGILYGAAAAAAATEVTVRGGTTTRKLNITVAPYAAQPRGAMWWRIRRANTPAIVDGTALTFAVRGSFVAAAGSQTLHRSRVTSTTHIDIIIDSNGRISLTVRLSTATNVTWRSTGAVAIGAMATLSAVIDTTQVADADKCKVWLNGVAVAGAWTTSPPATSAVLALAPGGSNDLIFGASDVGGGVHVTGASTIEWIGLAAGVIAGANALGPAIPSAAGWWLLLGGSRQAWISGTNAAGGSPFFVCRGLPTTDSAIYLGPNLSQRDPRRGVDGSHGWTIGTGWSINKDTGLLAVNTAGGATTRYTFASPLKAGTPYLVCLRRAHTGGTIRIQGVLASLATASIYDTGIFEGGAGAPVDLYTVVTPASDWIAIELLRAASTLVATDISLSVHELRHGTPLAFLGALGYGKFAQGGRGGEVRRVTSNSNGTAEGTLRWAIAGTELATGQQPITANTGWVAAGDGSVQATIVSNDLRLRQSAIGTMTVHRVISGLVVGRRYSAVGRIGFSSAQACATIQWRVLNDADGTELAAGRIISRPAVITDPVYYNIEAQFIAPAGGAVRLQLRATTDAGAEQRAIIDSVSLIAARTVIIEPNVGQVRLETGPLSVAAGALTIDARRAPNFYASLARLDGTCSNVIVRGWRAYVGNEAAMPASWPGSTGWTIYPDNDARNLTGQTAVNAKVWNRTEYGDPPWWLNLTPEVFPANTPLGQEGGQRDGISWGSTDQPVNNLYFDGSEVMWGCDESLSLFRSNNNQDNLLSDATVHRCIIGEGLYQNGHIDEGTASRTPTEHSKGVLIGPHSARVSMIENLLASNHDRNPQLSGFCEDMEYINNVVVNFGENGINLFGNCADELVAAGVIANTSLADAHIQAVLAAADPATTYPTSWPIIVAAQSRVNVLGNLLQRVDNTGAGAVAVDANTTRAPIRIQNDVPGRVALVGNVFIKKNGTINAIAAPARGNVNASGTGSVTPVNYSLSAFPFGSGFTPRLPAALNQVAPAAGDETVATAFARELRARLAPILGARRPDGSLHPIAARLVAECFPEQLAAVFPLGTSLPGYVAPTDARTEARNWDSVQNDLRRPPDRHGLIVADPSLFGMTTDPWAGAANGANIGGVGP